MSEITEILGARIVKEGIRAGMGEKGINRSCFSTQEPGCLRCSDALCRRRTGRRAELFKLTGCRICWKLRMIMIFWHVAVLEFHNVVMMERVWRIGKKFLLLMINLQMAREIALYYHEKWGGTGYPLGLAGEKIPVTARIMNIVDQYDALRSKRPYKPPFAHDKVVEIVTKGDGRTSPNDFDPAVLKAFLKSAEKIKEIYALYE